MMSKACKSMAHVTRCVVSLHGMSGRCKRMVSCSGQLLSGNTRRPGLRMDMNTKRGGTGPPARAECGVLPFPHAAPCRFFSGRKRAEQKSATHGRNAPRPSCQAASEKNLRGARAQRHAFRNRDRSGNIPGTKSQATTGNERGETARAQDLSVSFMNSVATKETRLPAKSSQKALP